MPYLMGGYPDLETSRAIGLAYADAGADLIELGVPFSDPLADGPVIHAAGTAALRAGATLPAVLDVARDIADRVPVVLMCYANPILSHGLERFLDELVAARVSGLIVPDLPLEEATDVRPACRAARSGPRPARRSDHAGRAAGADRRRGQRLPLHGVAHRDHRRTREMAGGLATSSRASRRIPTVPVAVGFGISTPEQAAAAAAAGADGVIVGTRLVRAVGRGDRPRRRGPRAGRGSLGSAV